MSYLFDVNAMYWGSASIVTPAGASLDGSANLTNANYPAEMKFKIAGVIDRIGVGVILPLKQTDGVTNTSGTLTVQISTYRDDGTTLVDRVTRTYTLGTAQDDFIRLARSRGATQLGIVCSGAAVNAGPATIGVSTGGPYLLVSDQKGNG